ncbi:MAG: DUF222 domain-containing protein [Streptosporangiales bacterium]|nr:DUF222 domain-containing protein [Streptosporangiales bacterium]
MIECLRLTVADMHVFAAETRAPGPEMQRVLDTIDPAAVSDDSRLRMVELYQRCEAALAARQQHVLAAFGYGDDPAGDHDTRGELAPLLRLSEGTVHSRLSVAEASTDTFTATLALLAGGQVTYWHLRALVDETQPLTPAFALAVEARVLPKAPGQTLSEYRAAVRRAVAAVDPAGAQERMAWRVRDRAAWVKPLGDGVSSLTAVMAGDVATAAWTRVDDLARTTTPGDDRTLDQRRADTVADLLLGTAPGHHQAPAARVEVTISADTLLGGDEPGELHGHGPIPAPTARALASRQGSTWRRLVIDPHTGWLRACGEKTYRPGDWTTLLTDRIEPVPAAVPTRKPSAALDRYVKTRDVRCIFPGCRRRAKGCDLDHTTRWEHGGATSAKNLHPLCRRHHRWKDRDDVKWRLRNHENATSTWTSPTGRVYHRHPHDHRDD